MNKIAFAAEFAFESHKGQKRKYKDEHYIVHPFRVAGWTAAIMPQSEDAICAAYLHDVEEDCGVSNDRLRRLFGRQVAEYVAELTNVSKQHPNLPRKERKRLDLEHIATISSDAKIIKMIDRWDNLKDAPLDVPESKSFLRSAYLKESDTLWKVLANDPSVVFYSEIITLPQLIARLADELQVKL